MIMDYQNFTPQIAPKIQDTKVNKTKSLYGNDIATLVLNAKVLIENKEYSLASHLLRKALYLNSFHKESLKLLAGCFQKLGQNAQTMRVLFLIDRIEESFESAHHLAQFQYENEQFSEAKESFFRALNKLEDNDPQLFEIFKNLGNIFLKENDFDGAEEFYHKAFSMNSNSDALMVNLGTLAVQRNEIELALARFRGALEINPKNDKAWVGLGIVHSQMGDTALAIANIESALDLNPLNRTAVQLAADWGLARLDYEYVTQVLTEYVSGVRYDEDMSLLLTHTFCLAGRLNEAKLELERMLLWNPTNPQLHQIEKEMKGLA